MEGCDSFGAEERLPEEVTVKLLHEDRRGPNMMFQVLFSRPEMFLFTSMFSC